MGETTLTPHGNLWEEDNLVVSERENNEDKKGEEKAIYILRKMLNNHFC